MCGQPSCDCAARRPVALLLARQSPGVGVAGGASVLLAGGALPVVESQFGCVGAQDGAHGWCACARHGRDAGRDGCGAPPSKEGNQCVVTERSPPQASGLQPQWSSGLIPASARSLAPLPVLPACVRRLDRTLCTLPTQSYSGVPRSVVPVGKSTNAPWTRRAPLRAGVFELTTPPSHGVNVRSAGAPPSGAKP